LGLNKKKAHDVSPEVYIHAEGLVKKSKTVRCGLDIPVIKPFPFFLGE
jgi:hypothetical protein